MYLQVPTRLETFGLEMPTLEFCNGEQLLDWRKSVQIPVWSSGNVETPFFRWQTRDNQRPTRGFTPSTLNLRESSLNKTLGRGGVLVRDHENYISSSCWGGIKENASFGQFSREFDLSIVIHLFLLGGIKECKSCKNYIK